MDNHKQERFEMTDAELIKATRALVTSPVSQSMKMADRLTYRLEAANQRIEGLERENAEQRRVLANQKKDYEKLAVAYDEACNNLRADIERLKGLLQNGEKNYQGLERELVEARAQTLEEQKRIVQICGIIASKDDIIRIGDSSYNDLRCELEGVRRELSTERQRIEELESTLQAVRAKYNRYREIAHKNDEGWERELSAERNARAKAEAKVAAVEKEARSLVADFDGWADAGRRVLKVLNALCEHEMPIGTCINCATQSPEPAAASAAYGSCRDCCHSRGWHHPHLGGLCKMDHCDCKGYVDMESPAPQPSQALRERPAHQRLAFMLRLYLNVDEGIALQVVNAIDARQLELLAEIEARIALIEDRHAK